MLEKSPGKVRRQCRRLKPLSAADRRKGNRDSRWARCFASSKRSRFGGCPDWTTGGMKRRVIQIGVVLVLLAYVASYVVFRKIYETREDVVITLYDEDSLVAGIAYFMHWPLILADSALTGRTIQIGNWRGD